MKKFGWDIKYSFWVIGAMIIAFPISLVFPHFLPFFIGCGLVLLGVKQLKNYKSINKWIKTQGKIIKTDIGTYKVSVGGYSQPYDYYFPLAYYSYSYNGDEKYSNKYAFDKKSIWSLDVDEVKKRLQELENGDTLNVYVNPEAPEEAVLNINISKERISHSYALLTAGGLILSIGVMLYVYS